MDKYAHSQKGQIPFAFIILVAMGWLFYDGQVVAASVLGVLLVLAIILVNRLPIFKRNQWAAFVQDSTRQLRENVVATAQKSPFPLVALSRDGRIYWYNDSFAQAMEIGDVIPLEIDEVMDLDLDKLWKGDAPDYLTIGDTIYKPTLIKYSAAVDEFAEDLIYLHLTDVTEVKLAQDRKIITMLLEVDNLSEVLNSAPDDRRPVIAAAIEKMLVDYAATLKGYMKRYSTNKSIIVCPFEVFRGEMKTKFPILDQVKTIELGNTLEPTLSIGVSYGNEDLAADYDAANQAKELALGRGGDQLVIKQGEKLTFFGGNSREVEKKSRVRSRVIAHALRDLMLESGHIYIMGHANPDMDCLGAAVGINAMARNLGVDASIVMDQHHRNVQDLMNIIAKEDSYADIYISPEECLERLKPTDLLVVVDVHSLGYVLNKELAEVAVRKVIIDHHRRTQDAISGATLSFIETYASSTSELVTELIQYIMDKPKLLKAEADSLLAGIMVDTKNFFYKTGSRTFDAASFLRKLGADTIDIRDLLSYDKELYLLKASIIKTAEVDRGVAIAVCPPGIQDPVIAAQAADEFLNLKGITASFVLAQQDEDVVISARSNGSLNVQVIMEAFGGGGHMSMSGAKVTKASAQEVKEQLKELLNTIQEEDADEGDTSQGRQERR